MWWESKSVTCVTICTLGLGSEKRYRACFWVHRSHRESVPVLLRIHTWMFWSARGKLQHRWQPFSHHLVWRTLATPNRMAFGYWCTHSSETFTHVSEQREKCLVITVIISCHFYPTNFSFSHFDIFLSRPQCQQTTASDCGTWRNCSSSLHSPWWIIRLVSAKLGIPVTISYGMSTLLPPNISTF